MADVFGTWSKENTLFVPQTVDEVQRFAPWRQGDQVVLTGNVLIPPKELFFPQTEELYAYTDNGREARITETVPETGSRVIFGMRSCDLKSLLVLDDVFLTKGYEDAYYARRRENTTIVALGCTHRGPACFCTSMGVNPAEADESDLQAYDLGETYGFKAVTEKGAKLLAQITGLGTDVASPNLPPAPAGGLEADVEGLPDKLRQMFYHPFWDEIYEKCLACGTCTFVCPTCHCFDIQNQNQGETGIKFRCWDSCMYPEYTLMAGGHNPRPTRKERLRNRFLDKLLYKPERYGKLGCVGCGRCILKCPVNVDIVKIINQLKEVALDA